MQPQESTAIHYIQFHQAHITDDEIKEVIDSLRSGWLTMGPKTVKFEEAFANYVKSPYAVAVNSCTAAMHLALKAIGLSAGDEVIVPALTFIATSEVVSYFNAQPVLVDVERDTHNMDVAAVERAITGKTRAIIPVHYGGQPCDLDELHELGKRYNLHIIEDAAHALPSYYKGKIIGSLGDLTCFSFYATKTLTTGEGGMVCTANPEWAEAVKVLRLHGITRDAWKRYAKGGSWFYEVVESGFKYNMTDVQAGLGVAQLRKVDWMLARRAEIARTYTQAFCSREELLVPYIKPDRQTAWHLYPLKLNLETLKIDRNQFIEQLIDYGIGIGVHFIPLYYHPYFQKNFDYHPRDFINSEWIYQRVVSLPIYPDMTEADTSQVINIIFDIIQKHKR
ncbi:MAG: DegT/DnrJ/EryC1/StrS family aminotransferase [Desulfobacca sp.]|nr:DegT/DnrJ/EryC1/StrS family aminotransferase [Desulfobacca sp.]